MAIGNTNFKELDTKSNNTMLDIALLGVTGSVGDNCLEVIRLMPSKFNLKTIMAYGKSYEKILNIVKEFKVVNVLISDRNSFSKSQYLSIKNDTGHKVNIIMGYEEAVSFLESEGHDICISAISGISGLEPTISAIKYCKRLIIANKESIVCGGDLFMNALNEYNTEVIPIDSEHHALFEILHSNNSNHNNKYTQNLTISHNNNSNVKNLIITASGGVIGLRKNIDLNTLKFNDVIRHPVWKMGDVLTVNSTTMMNKAFEILEASILFEIDKSKIEAVIHPEAIVHGMVRYIDDSVIMYAANPTMKTPIASALMYPEKYNNSNGDLTSNLDLVLKKSLIFSDISEDEFPLFFFAQRECFNNLSYIILLNALNEFFIKLFIREDISLRGIIDLIMEYFYKIRMKRELGTIKDIIGYHYEIIDILKNTFTK